MTSRRPERTPGRDERRGERPGRRERSGHRREYDGREPQRTFEARVDGVVRGVGAFRAVALRDLVERQFDGHPYAARRGIGLAERRGWIEQRKARGPKGGEFTVVVATPGGWSSVIRRTASVVIRNHTGLSSGASSAPNQKVNRLRSRLGWSGVRARGPPGQSSHVPSMTIAGTVACPLLMRRVPLTV